MGTQFKVAKLDANKDIGLFVAKQSQVLLNADEPEMDVVEIKKFEELEGLQTIVDSFAPGELDKKSAKSKMRDQADGFGDFRFLEGDDGKLYLVCDDTPDGKIYASQAWHLAVPKTYKEKLNQKALTKFKASIEGMMQSIVESIGPSNEWYKDGLRSAYGNSGHPTELEQSPLYVAGAIWSEYRGEVDGYHEALQAELESHKLHEDYLALLESSSELPYFKVLIGEHLKGGFISKDNLLELKLVMNNSAEEDETSYVLVKDSVFEKFAKTVEKPDEPWKFAKKPQLYKMRYRALKLLMSSAQDLVELAKQHPVAYDLLTATQESKDVFLHSRNRLRTYLFYGTLTKKSVARLQEILSSSRSKLESALKAFISGGLEEIPEHKQIKEIEALDALIQDLGAK